MLPMISILVALAVTQPEDFRITVFVSAPVRDGFVDTSKGIQDSVKDVRVLLSKKREFRVVDDREAADIAVIITARGVGSESYGARVRYSQFYNNAIIETRPIIAETAWVSAMLEVGEFRKELIGTRNAGGLYVIGAFSDCAGQIVGDLRTWVTANAGELKRRREQFSTSSPR
jgi:hypothetical protein